MCIKSLITCLSLLGSVPLFALTAKSAAPERSSLRITIHVYNYSAVSTKALASAKDEGKQIFKHAGLSVTWIDVDLNGGGRRNPQNSPDSWDETHIVLRILNQGRPGLVTDAAGEALHLQRIANVFLDRVASLSEEGEISIGQFLGNVIAHEIGHLLLGPNSHGGLGIMAARWSKQDIWRMSGGGLRFTPREIQQMQAKVKRPNLSQAVQVTRVP